MKKSQHDLISKIIKDMRNADLWNTGEKDMDDITTLEFNYLGRDEELLKNKPKIKLVIEWG